MRTSVVRRLAAVAAALAVTVLPGAVAPAHAAGEDDCKAGNVCAWSEPDFEGQLQQTPGRVTRCVRIELPWPDGSRSRIHSFYNRTRFQIETYVAEPCSGTPSTVLAPGTSAPKVATEITGFRMAPVCAQDSVCFYQNDDYSGAVAQNSDWNFGFCTSGGVAARSVYNTTDHTVSLFDTNGSCQNARAVDIPPHTYQSYDTTFYGFRVKPR
ncbi:hypothetical protein GCM10009639_03690 [Kitasatospora putterlickiae]|uniref:Peptidase inhibitor family I36 n=1 Tax=Kitasatospora putterlickiae TaxID=221725 RepID=A0ABP4I7L1_9ACTN